jgi:endogenous inhibitor of DNA gyrase (YacG/DUF329 family)
MKTKAHQNPIWLICPGCGISFNSNNRDVTHNHRKFCTRKCYFSFRKRRRTISCETCEKIFERHNANRRFCSRDCFNKASLEGKVFKYKVYNDARGYSYYRGVPVYRLIVEKVIGRKLKPDERVHHINGVKADNRNHNLLVCDASYHRSLHAKMSQKYMEEHFSEN